MVVIDTSLKDEDSSILYHINSSDVYNLLQDISGSKLIIDLRSKQEYDKSHIRTSITLPPPIPISNNNNNIINKFNINKYISSNATAKHWNLVFNRVVIYSDKPFLYNIDELESLNEFNYTGIVDLDVKDWDHTILKYFLSKRKKTKIMVFQDGFSTFQHSYPFMCNSSEVKVTGPLYPSEIIVNFLYLGGTENAATIEQLKNLKITHIVNMASELDDVYPFTFKYYRADLDDRPKADIYRHFEPIIQFINSAKKEGGRVLVHCAMGISRSTTVVLAYLMKEDHMSFIDSYKFVKSKRTFVNPNFGFVQQLKQYEIHLNQEREKEIKQLHQQNESKDNTKKTENEDIEMKSPPIITPQDDESPLVSSGLPILPDSQQNSLPTIILKDVPTAATAVVKNQLQRPSQVQLKQEDQQIKATAATVTLPVQSKTSAVTTSSLQPNLSLQEVNPKMSTSSTSLVNTQPMAAIDDSIFKFAEDQTIFNEKQLQHFNNNSNNNDYEINDNSPKLIPQSSL